MKASELRKKGVAIADIYTAINSINEVGQYKYFIPHNIYVPDHVITELIENGFKVYKGEWMRGDIGLIIEW